jgi:hypothetical protein
MEQRKSGGSYVPRFAGEAFGHHGNPKDGPMLRRLASEVAWKQPPSAKIKAELTR